LNLYRYNEYRGIFIRCEIGKFKPYNENQERLHYPTGKKFRVIIFHLEEGKMKRSLIVSSFLTAGMVLLTGFEAAYASGKTGTPQPSPTPSVEAAPVDSGSARTQAEKGVMSNSGWMPYSEEINGVKMALVPAGCFQMGSTDENIAYWVDLYQEGVKNGVDQASPDWFADEKPGHRVCFEKPFWIDLDEVTNSQFKKFGGKTKYPSFRKDADRPREQINWNESDDFCKKRGARLPSEAEWEYASRGPDSLLYPWGNTWDQTLLVWNLASKELDATVGSKPEGNSWVGAQDMLGNINEWVNDWYSDTYYASLGNGTVDPQGPDGGTERVIRGGSWYDENPAFFHTAFRAKADPEKNSQTRAGGFRCALSY
jgi:formylglycine-generating enzyme required for sulfatase activity